MIQLKDGNFSYGDSKVLHEITLTLTPGKLTCLIGPNGSGKTTLLKILAGIHNITSGQLSLEGHNYGTLTSAEKASAFSYMSSEITPSVEMTVTELIDLSTEVYHCQKTPEFYCDSFRDWLMRQLSLDAFSDRALQSLSSGEKQRCFFALALLQKSKIGFFDEPISHMDPGQAMHSLEIINSLTRQGFGALVVMHDLNRVIASADHVIALKKGEVFAEGKPGEILTPDRLNELFDTQSYHQILTPEKQSVIYQRREPIP